MWKSATKKPKILQEWDKLTQKKSDTMIFHRGAFSAKSIIEDLKKKSVKVTESQRAENSQFIDKMKDYYENYNAGKYVKPDYDKVLPENFEKTKKIYENKSEEAIKNQAMKLLMPQYKQKADSVKNKAEQSILTLNEKLTDENQKTDEKLTKLGEDSLEAEENLQDKMIMQGIVNSSINDNQKAFIDNVFSEQEKILMDKLNTYADELNLHKQRLKNELENSLIVYKLNYSKDLILNIDKLTQEEGKLKSDIEKYNQKTENEYLKYQADRQGKIDQLETDRQYKERRDMEAERAWEYQNKTFKGDKLPEMNKRLDEARSFYKSLPKNVSLKLLEENDTTLKSYLSFYYDDLLREIKENK